VPTFAEAGMAELTPGAWYGLFAPCDLPVARQRAIGAASATALARGSGTQGLDAPGRIVAGPDFLAFLQTEEDRWRPLIATASP
jgi:tripartite-type tricarboxylate transporter receptor subunit TctC